MTIGKQMVELDSNLLSFIEKWKNRPGSEIMVLHKVQEVYGFVPREVAMEVSRIMGIPLAKIYGIITFYHLFKLKKPGKNQISVCMGTACYLKGGNDLIMEIEDILDVSINSTSPDGIFSLELVRCVGCCGLAPVMLVNGKVYGNLKKDMLPAIFADYRKLEGDKANG